MLTTKFYQKLFRTGGSERWTDKVITNAELEALLGTPITIVAAPPVGYHLVFTGAEVYKPANADAQTVPGNAELEVRYTNAIGLQVGQLETTGVFDQTTAQMRHINPYKAASLISSIVPVTNSPLVIHVANADMSAGDAVMHIRTYYRVLADAI